MTPQVEGEIKYKALLYGEGILKTLFKAVKSASSGLGLDRVFITGVSPIVLSDMTSGYNVAENITLHPDFSTLCGFREAEVKAALDRLAQECGLGPEQAAETLDLMRTYYNGYRFDADVADYIMASEATLARGYADLTMIVRPEMRRYQLLDLLIEFKYLALSDLGLSGEQMRSLAAAEVRGLPAVQAALAAALAQLEGYRVSLAPQLGPGRQPRAFAIISLGFERLLWQELGLA